MHALPPILLTSEPGSFARRTFEVRVPRILDDVLATNDFSPAIVAALRALREEIVGGTLQLLREPTADAELWNAQAHAHAGKTWLDLPWFWAEAFLYRRILEATQYFANGRDPYAPQKHAELEADRAPRAVGALLAQTPGNRAQAFPIFLHASLWGNRVDLSMHGFIALDARHDASNLLADDTARVWAHAQAHRGAITILCDNAGTELGFDLALADFLLRADLAARVTLQLKPQPTFVSDALIADVRATLTTFAQAAEPALRDLATRLAHAETERRFILRDHPFWVSGSFFHDLPGDLRAALAENILVIAKGDANYRRLIGDCHWEPATPFAAAVAHFPAPVVALRTTKSQVIVGLQPGEAERLRAQDPAWLTSGQRGVIQFHASANSTTA